MAESINFPTDVSEQTIKLLYNQFNQYQAWRDLIDSIVKQDQELVFMWQQLYLLRSLDTALGLQLDHLGEIIGLARGNITDDEEYRDALRFQVQLNKSAGETEFIILALKKLSKAERVQLIEVYPAAMILYISSNPADLPNDFKEKINALALGGVAVLSLSQSDFGTNEPFTFASELASEDYGGGFSWLDGGGQPVGDDQGIFAWTL